MYYVLIVDVYGTTRQVDKFETREDAVEYITKLPDEHYMVVLRNDDFSMKPLHFSE